MTKYRDEVREFERETRWTFWRMLPLLLIFVAVLAAVGFGLRSAGIIGGTIVEREVFEQSFQRSEALKTQIAVDKAAIAEIEAKLLNPNLDSDTRYNLEAQVSAARVRIATTEDKQ